MKKAILIILGSIFGLILILGGSVFAWYMYEAHTVNFDKYLKGRISSGISEIDSRIYCPEFLNGHPVNVTEELWSCYNEVDSACVNYCTLVARKYKNNAELDFTVENTGKVLTIKFTGTGYPENGDPEPLERTYIFDIDGVGKDKIPVLLNRDEIVGY